MANINGRNGVLLIDTIDRSDEATSWVFGPGTRQTFAQMRGQTPRALVMTITQNDAPGSLYTLAVQANGATVPGVYRPHGNAVASASQPHYTFTATPSGPTGDVILGGDAAEDGTEALTVEVTWQITAWSRRVA